MERYQWDLEKIKQNLKGERDHEVRMKVRLLIRIMESKESVSLSCDRIGLNRKTFYSWLNKVRAANFALQAVKNKSRRPLSSPRKISFEIEEYLCALRIQTGHSGGRIIASTYFQVTGMQISHSVIDKLFARRGLVKKHRVKKNPFKKRYASKKPLERVQFDALWLGIEDSKGNPAYTIDAVDCCSRFAFAKVCSSVDTYSSKQALEEFIDRFGKPQLVQTDNGVEFTARYVSELNSRRIKPPKKAAFEKVLMDQKILHYLIKPRTPQHNGKIERFHRTLLRWVYAMDLNGRPLQEINTAIQSFIDWYNYQRPHSALNYLPPADIFFGIPPSQAA